MENRLLLWDIDGTLMSCYNDGTKALNETFRRRTGVENACGEIKVGTAMDSALVEGIMKHLGIPDTEKNKIIGEFADILQDILDKNLTKRVLPGIHDILEILSENEDVYMGLITSNFKIGAYKKLASVGLDSYFKFGGYGDVSGEKWDAAVMAIEYAENLAGESFDRKNIFVIGDTAYDIACAKRLGVKSVAVATGWMHYDDLKKQNSDYIFESFENYREFIDLILK